MPKPMYQIRIIASACITRCDKGEAQMETIVDSYNLGSVDQDLVVTEIAARRPDMLV